MAWYRSNGVLVFASGLITLLIVEALAWVLWLSGFSIFPSDREMPELSYETEWLDVSVLEETLPREKKRAESLKGHAVGEKGYRQLFPPEPVSTQPPMPRNFNHHNAFDEVPLRRFQAVRWTSDRSQKIYDVRYTMDRHFRRLAPLISEREGREVLLLGGSFTFGEGLEDQETLANRIMVHSSARVHTQAYFGYGPGDILRNSLRDDLDYFAGLPDSKITAIYVMPDFHIERALGPSFFAGPGYQWAESKPQYVCQGSAVEYQGMFSEQVHWPLFRIFHRMAISKVGKISFPLSWEQEHFSCLATLLDQIRKKMSKSVELERFYVLLYPGWRLKGLDLLRSELLERNIGVLNYSSLPVYQLAEGLSNIPLDGHPGLLANEILGQFIARDLQ